jgi:predicted PurR-regulated permease PerM
LAQKTSERKVVKRTVAIALGIICIVLVAGLVSAIAIYTPQISDLQSQITQKDSTISSLNSQISVLNNSLNQTKTDAASKDSQIAALTQQIQYYDQYYFNIISLNASGILFSNSIIQYANNYTSIWNDYLDYAGYIIVQVQLATSNTTYAEVVYSTTYGVNYDNNVTLGTGGTAAFPVLPGLVEVRIGNTDTMDLNNATITAVYYY